MVVLSEVVWDSLRVCFGIQEEHFGLNAKFTEETYKKASKKLSSSILNDFSPAAIKLRLGGLTPEQRQFGKLRYMIETYQSLQLEGSTSKDPSSEMINGRFDDGIYLKYSLLQRAVVAHRWVGDRYCGKARFIDDITTHDEEKQGDVARRDTAFANIKWLLKHGADANLSFPDTRGQGQTALFNNLWSPKVAELLLDAGADVNHKDCYNFTAINSCASVALAEYLLKRGAKPSSEDEGYLTAPRDGKGKGENLSDVCKRLKGETIEKIKNLQPEFDVTKQNIADVKYENATMGEQLQFLKQTLRKLETIDQFLKQTLQKLENSVAKKK